MPGNGNRRHDSAPVSAWQALLTYVWGHAAPLDEGFHFSRRSPFKVTVEAIASGTLAFLGGCYLISRSATHSLMRIQDICERPFARLGPSSIHQLTTTASKPAVPSIGHARRWSLAMEQECSTGTSRLRYRALDTMSHCFCDLPRSRPC
jgi:hypothetical protein